MMTDDEKEPDVNDTRVLLLHGMAPRNPQHWMWPLADQLRSERIPVQYPQLPHCTEPNLDAWRDMLLTELSMLGEGDRVVVAHSLGTVLFALAGADLPAALRATRVLLVAPPAPHELADRVASFRCDDDVFGAGVAAGAGHVTVVGRSQDPHRSYSLGQLTAGWDAEVHELPGNGHFNPPDGHGEWPWVFDWVKGVAGPPRLGPQAHSLSAA